jgi:hypothetical protein
MRRFFLARGARRAHNADRLERLLDRRRSIASRYFVAVRFPKEKAMDHNVRMAALIGALALVSLSAAAPEQHPARSAAPFPESAWSDAESFPVECLQVASQPKRHCLYYGP